MEDTSFLYFTQDEIIEKIDIDPRLVDSFKRVMTKLQNYFNANGYTFQRDYKQYLEKYLLNSDDKNMRFYVDKIERKGVGGFYAGGAKFERNRNEICINEEILKRNPEVLDSTLCHEFIHFLVMHGLEYGQAEPDLINGGFINESLTEMLTQQMYPKSNAYDAQVAMQKFANLLSGKENNFSRFLQGFVDARYSSPDWENYRRYSNTFQSDFKEVGYINLLEAQNNSNFIQAQRSLISLFMRPKGKKNINEYIETINKLLERPVADTDYINNQVVADMDKTIISGLRLNDKEINDFLQKKLAELRDLIVESRKYDGKKVHELEFGGRKIIITENMEVIGSYVGLQISMNPKTGEMSFLSNGKKLTININDIDFNERDIKINSQIERLSTYFGNNSSKDLSMISDATKQQGDLTKIEKFTLPGIGDEKNIVIYVATYGDKVIILNNSIQIDNVENIEQSRYIGVTSKNPKVAAINFENLGSIDNALLFSSLNSKQLYIKSIAQYSRQIESELTEEEINKAVEIYRISDDFIEESEQEIRAEAIRKIAESRFDSLSKIEKDLIFSVVYKQNPRFIISTKNGKLDVSTMLGERIAFKGKSEVLYDSKGIGMYNEVLESISKNVIPNMSSEKSSISLDTGGNIIFLPKKDKEMELMQVNPQFELEKINSLLDNLRAQYANISIQIENLMKEKTVSPIVNYQEQLNVLIQQRDILADKISEQMSTQKTYQSIVDYKKEETRKATLWQVERLLGIKITDTAGMEVDSNKFGGVPQVVSKDINVLSKELENINQQLEALYYDGQLDIKTYQTMKKVVRDEYGKFSKNAFKPKIKQERIDFDKGIERQSQIRYLEKTKDGLISKKQEILRSGWRQQLEEIKKQGFEVPNLDDILRQQEIIEQQRMNTERLEKTGRRIM